jgi:hypothetical protein
MLDRFGRWLTDSFLGWIVLLIIMTVVVLALTILPVLGLQYLQCEDRAVSLDIETDYTLWGGCYYNLDGVWYTDDVGQDILRQQYQLEIDD